MSRLGNGGRDTGGIDAALERHIDSDHQQLAGTEKRLRDDYRGKSRQRGKAADKSRSGKSKGRR